MPNKDLGSDKSKLCTGLKSVLRVQKEQILIMIMTCMAGFEKSTGKNNKFFAVLRYFFKLNINILAQSQLISLPAPGRREEGGGS